MLLVIVKDESDKMIDGRFHAHALHFYKTISRTRRSGTVAPPRSRAIYHASTRLKSNAPNEKTSSLLSLVFHRDFNRRHPNEDAAISIRRPGCTARSTKDPFVLYAIALFSVPRIGLVLRVSILCMVDATEK